MLTTVEKVMHLQRCDLFERVPSDLLVEVAEIADEVEHDIGHIVYNEGDAADALYVIVDGSVDMLRDAVPVSRVDATHAFGAWAVLDTGPRLFTAVAREPVHLLEVHRLDLEELIADHTLLSAALLASLAGRLKRIVDER